MKTLRLLTIAVTVTAFTSLASITAYNADPASAQSEQFDLQLTAPYTSVEMVAMTDVTTGCQYLAFVAPQGIAVTPRMKGTAPMSSSVQVCDKAAKQTPTKSNWLKKGRKHSAERSN